MPFECPAVPGLVLQTPVFPAKYPTPMVADEKLGKALKGAMDAAIAKNARFRDIGAVLVSLEKPGAHPMAQHNGENTYFGASMVKAAALYGLYELRTTMRAIAKELACKAGSEEEALFVAGEHIATGVLANMANLPVLPKAPHGHLVPRYDKAFKAVVGAGGDLTFDFHRDFAPSNAPPSRGYSAKGHIENMVVYSDNQHSAACIRACGYGYLNGALRAAGFLETTGKKASGIWLAGDYGAKNKEKYPAYEAEVTRGTSAQAGSAMAFARMMTLLDDGTLFGKQADAIAGMKDALAKGAAFANTFYDDDPPSPFPLRVLYTKFGYSGLNASLDVHSECAILGHDSGKRFVFVWMNLPGAKAAPIEFRQVAELARDAVEAYLR